MYGIRQQRDAAAQGDDPHLQQGGDAECRQRQPNGANTFLIGCESGVGIQRGVFVPVQVKNLRDPAEYTGGCLWSCR